MKVKVWNDDDREYTEEFQGKMISIKPNSFIIMERGEAATFMGQYKPIQIDQTTGRHVGIKKLRREFLPEDEEIEMNINKKKHVCMLDNKEFASEEDLEKHIVENHMDKIADNKSKKEVVKKTRRKKVIS